MNTLQVVVFRESKDERTCAVVRCHRTKKIRSGDTLCDALIQALTNWFKYAREGKLALASSSNDFNVGDLSVYYQDKTLQPYLNQEGIVGLELETYQGAETDWSYDTHLFDYTKLENS